MKLNRNELKKIQYDFNRICNRLLRADIDDYNHVLARFVGFIKSKEIIMDYIRGCGESTQDWNDEFAEVRKSYGGAIFILGDTDEEETINVYNILKYAVEHNEDIPRKIALGYASSNKYADKLKAFNERVVYVLIQHIEAYLTKVGIDMGMDENSVFNITNNGQVNIATDNASIEAENTNGVDASELATLIQNILNCSSELSKEDEDIVKESLDVVNQEIVSQKPRKKVVKKAMNTLKSIKGTVEFGAAIATLIAFIQPLL